MARTGEAVRLVRFGPERDPPSSKEGFPSPIFEGVAQTRSLACLKLLNRSHPFLKRLIERVELYVLHNQYAFQIKHVACQICFLGRRRNLSLSRAKNRPFLAAGGVVFGKKVSRWLGALRLKTMDYRDAASES
jgi:hypothetical protein